MHPKSPPHFSAPEHSKQSRAPSAEYTCLVGVSVHGRARMLGQNGGVAAEIRVRCHRLRVQVLLSRTERVPLLADVEACTPQRQKWERSEWI